MDSLWRLIWALPMVLLTGVAVALLLKRVVQPPPGPARLAARMSVRESMPVSNDTRVHLIESDGQTYLLVESPGGTVLQATQSRASEGKRPRVGLGPRWARHFLKAVSR